MSSLRGSVAAILLGLSMTLSACSSNGVGGSERVRSPAGPPIAVKSHGTSRLHGTLLDPPLARPVQRLRDTNGRPFSLAERPAGELTLLFFGYTHCPDVCPTTMADLASARRQLPEQLRSRVTVVFVTEDPKRDPPGQLRGWLDGFDVSFVGLIGGNPASKAILNELYLPETRVVPNPEEPIKHPHSGMPHSHGDYGVEHSGVIYAFGPGSSVVIYTTGARPTEYAADFTRLLEALAAD